MTESNLEKSQKRQERAVLRLFSRSALYFWLPVLLILLIANEVSADRSPRIDDQLLLAVYSLSSPGLDSFFKVLTVFGNAIFLAPLAAAAISWLYITNRRIDALFVAFAVGGTAFINMLLKALFARHRPDLWEQIIIEHGYSFPSGHAMMSSAVAFTAITLFWTTAYRLPVILVSVLYFVSISFSRLYLGVHYPSDILAGWLISFLWIMLLSNIFSRYRKSRSINSLGSPSNDTGSDTQKG